MFKRILLTAVLGGGLLFTIPSSAQANPHASDSHQVFRHDHPGDQGSSDWGGTFFGGYGGYYGSYRDYGSYVSPLYAPRLQFRGFDRVPGFYYAPPGIGAPSYYLPYLADVFGDEYFVTYGFRCNGYRDGWYFNRDGSRSGSYRHNADCDDFYARHGYWYGIPVCDNYDAAVGYCDNE